MIIITGGAGFIGSALLWQLNQAGYRDILIVDDLQAPGLWKNLRPLRYSNYMHKEAFLEAVKKDAFDQPIEAVFHMGACSSTTEMDMDYLWRNNVAYSQSLCLWALKKKARFIYASSAATYGDGEQGFEDSIDDLETLQPLNPYGYSKHVFDLWLKSEGLFDQVVGLKFFNVFGPNEWHKDSMRSMVCKGFDEIQKTAKLRLFKSYRDGFGDGEQVRDFIYVKDCVAAMLWLYQNQDVCGLFNMGSGQTKSWNDLADAVFNALELPLAIDYIEMPETLRSQYQYYTKADMGQWQVRCPLVFTPFREAVSDYVKAHLIGARYLTHTLTHCV